VKLPFPVSVGMQTYAKTYADLFLQFRTDHRCIFATFKQKVPKFASSSTLSRLCPLSTDIATGHSDHLSVIVDRSLKIAYESASQLCRILCLAFPDRENPPSEASQLPSLASISDTIPLQLWKPEVKTCRWRLPPRAAMPMPKTPMDQDHRTVSFEHDIGRPWQSCLMQAKPKPHRMQRMSYNQLRLRISGTNRRHVETSLMGGDLVHLPEPRQTLG
jgi:hypothetical protein